MTVYDDLDAILLVDPGVCPPLLRKGAVHVCVGRFSYMSFVLWSSRRELDPDGTGRCNLCGETLP